MTFPASDLFARVDVPVWLVTARAGERRGGLIATCVCQASIAEALPRVLVGLGRQHHTWEIVESSRAFAVHLLGLDNFPWVERFGMHTSRDGDKFEGLRCKDALTGSPLLPDALGWLECRVESALESGDRTFYLAEVIAASLHEGVPLTTRAMIERAGPAMRQRLKEQLQRDAAVDAPAIRAWRDARRASPSP